jgi:predicted flap endonuclease-1-like 5' DNA nuclease
MTWLQENWIVAVVGLLAAVVLLWWLFGRSKADDLAPPAIGAAPPAKPLEPVKPEIVAAEPARFKPIEPAPAPVAKAPAPPPAPAATAEPQPAVSPPTPVPTPAPKAPTPIEPIAVEPVAPPSAPEPAPIAAPTSESAAPRADNLQLLKGVGPKMVALLGGLGVTSFQQIADWTDADVAAIDPQLGAFQGRIARDNIVDQAGYLARGDKAGFEAKYGALGGDL